jgi:hypothetical protein
MSEAECIHGLSTDTCGLCSPPAPASGNLGSTRRASAQARSKQELMNEISDTLGISRVRASTGSTDPRVFWDAVANAVGVERQTTKTATARLVAESAGLAWPPGADSSDTGSGGGGTVTAQGLAIVLTAVRRHAES